MSTGDLAGWAKREWDGKCRAEAESRTLPAGVPLGAAAPERTGIVHLGLGNVHRAHTAVYTAKALAAQPRDWGLVGVANRPYRIVDALRNQDNLYSILQLTPDGEQAGVVDVHRRTLVAAEDAPQVVQAIADPAHKIVTFTVWEDGYHRSAGTCDLNLDSPDIKVDLADPASRRKRGAAPDPVLRQPAAHALVGAVRARCPRFG